MCQFDEETVKKIAEVLCDEQKPLKMRFRALFTLKNIGGKTAIQCMASALSDPSALLKHEICYCLGQMQDSEAFPVLVSVLEDKQQEAMVRHEAGEALGALAVPEARPILEKYMNDEVVEVAETCQIALNRIDWTLKPTDIKKLSTNPYHSVDPAPPSSVLDVEALKKSLLDENETLFNRYRAMFSLRNIGTVEAVQALGEGLSCSSALFRHEIAFVLGQMQHETSVPYLKKNLEDKEESAMVRHECAEALGAIATEECMDILNVYANDEKRVVKESCEIALDMLEYEVGPEFQYANLVTKVASESCP